MLLIQRWNFRIWLQAKVPKCADLRPVLTNLRSPMRWPGNSVWMAEEPED